MRYWHSFDRPTAWGTGRPTHLTDLRKMKGWKDERMKRRPIKPSQQTWRYFNPGSQHMLPRLARIQRGIVGPCKHHEYVRVLSWCQAEPYSKEFPSYILGNWHSDTANRQWTKKPVNNGKLGASAIQHPNI